MDISCKRPSWLTFMIFLLHFPLPYVPYVPLILDENRFCCSEKASLDALLGWPQDLRGWSAWSDEVRREPVPTDPNRSAFARANSFPANSDLAPSATLDNLETQEAKTEIACIYRVNLNQQDGSNIPTFLQNRAKPFAKPRCSGVHTSDAPRLNSIL